MRIFLSSPFDGMDGERKTFMDTFAPTLKAMAARKGLTVTFVDMRLGITSDMGKKKMTVRLCERGGPLHSPPRRDWARRSAAHLLLTRLVVRRCARASTPFRARISSSGSLGSATGPQTYRTAALARAPPLLSSPLLALRCTCPACLEHARGQIG